MNKFLSIVKNVAPWLAGTFGTPVMGLAVNALCSMIPADQAKVVQDAHAADPVNGAAGKLADMFQQGVINIDQIKAAEAKHQETMAALGYKNLADLDRIAADDRDSARKREVALKDRTPAVLATIIVIGAIIISIAIVSGNAPAMKDATTAALGGAIVGYIFAEVKQVYNYYFGSSSSSRSKDETISAMAKGG